MSNQPVYLGIDPGGRAKSKSKKTTGWATANELGDIVSYGQVSEDEFEDFFIDLLNENEIRHVVMEDYKNESWKNPKARRSNQVGNQTSKHIGKMEMLCKVKGIPITLQDRMYKPAGYLWAGLGEAPKNHDISHQFDGVAHLVYWLQTNGIRPPGRAIPKELR